MKEGPAVHCFELLQRVDRLRREEVKNQAGVKIPFRSRDPEPGERR